MVRNSGQGDAKVTNVPGIKDEPPAGSAPLNSPPNGDLDAPGAQTGEPTAGGAVGGDAATESRAAGFAPRWWVGVTAGLLVSAPLAWLLSHAALLPFFLGIFFYVLFGLVIGAIVHRVAAPGRPYSSFSVLGGTTLIVLFGWSLSIWQESEDCPSKLAETALRKTRNIGDRTGSEFHAAVAGQIREFIAQQYPPGGALGFVWWAADSGKIPRDSMPAVQTTLQLPHRGAVWLIRVVAAIAALAFGVGSQTFLLRLARDPIVRRMDEE